MTLRNFIISCVSLLLWVSNANATHVLGGTIMYRHISDSTYEVTLLLYRDCSPFNATFPSTVTIQVRDVNGNLFAPSKNMTITLDSTRPVNSYLPCVNANAACVEEGWYSTIVSNLPDLSGGYHLYYQYCCRQASLANITNPLANGMSLYTYIPPQTVNGFNSSPVWNRQPPPFVCQGSPMNFDYGATDADGDSLVFSYYTPYIDAPPTFPAGVATFSLVNWVGGYSAINACGGANLTMNAQTGFIIGTPPNLGLFAAGVRCEEFRNGIKIGEILRDYPFPVVTCTPITPANFTGPAVTCFGSTVQFSNNSSGATTYLWDFGDTTITNDTSTMINPSWNYSSAGTYTVTLIVDPNTGCADTSTQVIIVELVTAYGTWPTPIYSGQPVQFTDSSYTSSGAPIVMWTWDFGDLTSSSLQNPQHTYSSQGSYTITLTVLSANGCLNTYTIVIIVNLFNSTFENSVGTISVFPNPSHGNFLIQFGNYQDDATITLTNVLGQVVWLEEHVSGTNHECNAMLPDGIYTLQCRTAKEILNTVVEIQ